MAHAGNFFLIPTDNRSTKQNFLKAVLVPH
jgi:hypothetical protein